MATAEHIKSLIRSHLSEDDERFYTLALQVAAHEAHQGHGTFTHDIREIIDKARRTRGSNTLLKFPQDLAGLVLSQNCDLPLSALVLPEPLKERIQRVIHELRQQAKLTKQGVSNRRKLLLTGPLGTGKTMTARILSHELRLPLRTIQVDKLVKKFMGETGAKLGRSSTLQETSRASISSMNSMPSRETVLLKEMLEKCAVFRRFDDVLHYKLPDETPRQRLIENVLRTSKGRLTKQPLLAACERLSQAEVDHACHYGIKQAILSDKAKVETATVIRAFQEISQTHPRK